MPVLIYPVIASVFAIAAAISDLKTRRIPNWLSASAFFSGLFLHAFLEGWPGLFKAAAAAFIAGGIFLLFFLAGGMGAGDVKLIGSLAAVFGLASVPYLLLFTALAGGVLALALAVRSGRLGESLGNVGRLASHHASKGLVEHPQINVRNEATLRLPYALPIAIGVAITFYLQEVAK